MNPQNNIGFRKSRGGIGNPLAGSERLRQIIMNVLIIQSLDVLL